MAASSRLRKQLDESGGSGGSKLNESFVAVRERLKAMAPDETVRHGAALARRHQEGLLAGRSRTC